MRIPVKFRGLLIPCAFLAACNDQVVEPDASAAARQQAAVQWRTDSSADNALALTRAYFPELQQAASGRRELGAHFDGGTLTLTTRDLTFRVRHSEAPTPHGDAWAAGNDHVWMPIGGARLEEAWVRDTARGTQSVTYTVALPDGVRRIHDAGDYLELLGANGQPVLRFHPMVVRDLNGTTRRGDTTYVIANSEARITSTVLLDGLAPPLVVDPAWSSTASLAAARAQHAAVLLGDGRVLYALGINSVSLVATAEVYDPATGTFASAASPGMQGNLAAGVPLPNGRALVMAQGSTQLRIYDPVTDTWATGAALSEERFLATATLLASGRVLFVGGSSVSTSEVYDPATNTVAAPVPLSVVHRGHAVARLQDDRVLVISGSNSTVGEVPVNELYDPAANSWSVAAPPLVARHYASATLLRDGRVLVAGGFAESGVIAQCEIYDPIANTWTATGSLAQPRAGHAATLLTDGRVMVMGGSDGSRDAQNVTEIYDPATGSWSNTVSTAVARENGTATQLPTGAVLFVGGYASNPSFTVYATAEVYTPSLATWSSASATVAPRCNGASTLLPSGRVLVAGGSDCAGDDITSAELYNVATGAWSSAAATPGDGDDPTLTLLQTGDALLVGAAGGAIYHADTNAWLPAAIPGNNRHSATLLPSGDVLVLGGDAAAALRYDPATNTTTAIAPLATNRGRHAAVLLPSGLVLVVGGTGSSPLATAELYNPLNDTWSSTTPMPVARGYARAVLMPSGRVLVVGSEASSSSYDPVAQTWAVDVAMGGNMTLPRVALLPSGSVLAVDQLGGAQVYEPALNAWSDSASSVTAHGAGIIANLPTGDVLVAAGPTSVMAERYSDTGTSTAYRPVVTGPDELVTGCSSTLEGVGFRGMTEGSNGHYSSSPTDVPLVRLQSIEGHRLWSLIGHDFSETSVTVDAPTELVPGYYIASIIANASYAGRVVNVLANTTPVAQDANLATDFDTPLMVTLQATDLEGQSLTWTIVTPPSAGTLSGVAPNLLYTPTDNTVTSDSFTFEARDCGLTSNVATVTIAIADVTPPVLVCPADLAVDAPSAAGAVVTYTSPTVTDNVTVSPVVVVTPASGEVFPVGTTVVTATAEDAAGNSATCTFNVVVNDTSAPPPTITCPADITETATSDDGAAVDYVVSASDGATVSATPASGSQFAVGTTTVTATATNADGETAQCSFVVTVEPAPAPTPEPEPRVLEIRGGNCSAGGDAAFAALATLLVFVRRRVRGVR